MEKITFREELISQFVNREVKKKSTFVGIAFSVILILMFFFTYSFNVHTILFLPMLIFFSIIFAVIHATSRVQLEDLAKSTYFVITDNTVAILLDKTKLNLLNKIGIARNESKSGVKFNQTIKISEISSAETTKNEMIIKSDNYNPFTNNGRIVIPKEVEGYENVIASIFKKLESLG